MYTNMIGSPLRVVKTFLLKAIILKIDEGLLDLKSRIRTKVSWLPSVADTLV